MRAREAHMQGQRRRERLGGMPSLTNPIRKIAQRACGATRSSTPGAVCTVSTPAAAAAPKHPNSCAYTRPIVTTHRLIRTTLTTSIQVRE